MAALLVALAVMAVLMSVALPVWRHAAQREKEAELVFRGQQYVRAIRLFQMKTQTLPTSIDLLVQGHYLRKKYKDPITNEDFELVGAGGVPGQTGQAGAGQPGTAQAGQQGGRGPQTVTAGGGAGRGQPAPSTAGSTSGTAPTGTVGGGMMGVRSKSKDESIRLYLGRNHYNEWVFLYAGQQQQPGGLGGRGQPGGIGGQGGRGQPGGVGPGGPGAGGGRGPGGAGPNPSPGRGSPFPFPPAGGGPGRGRGGL